MRFLPQNDEETLNQLSGYRVLQQLKILKTTVLAKAPFAYQSINLHHQTGIYRDRR